MKPMDDEQIRLLRATAEGRLRTNEHGRYVVDGGARPDRKAREALLRKQFITYPSPWLATNTQCRLTSEGRAAMDLIDATPSA